MTEKSIPPLALAVDLLGGQTAVARAAGGKVRQQHVWNWLRVRGGTVPPAAAAAAAAIAAACRAKDPGTAVTEASLCPGFPWDSLKSVA
jgi:hypothetical protein